MATNPITKQELIDAATDAETLESVVNGASNVTVTSRLGRAIPTLAKAINDVIATDVSMAAVNELAKFNNEIRILFNGRISVDITTSAITFPSGIAMRNGELYKSFTGETMKPGASANIYWFDYASLLTDPPTSPFKTVSSGTPVPVPEPDFCFLGSYYYNLFTSYFPFEYTNAPKVYQRLSNDMYNGNFSNAAKGVTFYGDRSPLTLDNAPLVATNNAALNALGCMYALKFEPGSPLLRNFAEVDYGPRGYDGAKFAFVSVLVHSADGTWNFGTGASGPYVYLVWGTEGTGFPESNAQAYALKAYDDLGNNVRRYYLPFPVSALTAGKYIKYLRIGMGVGSDVANTFLLTGVWASLSNQSYRPGYGLRHNDTNWPNWANTSGAATVRTREAVLALGDRVTALEVPSRKGLKALADALLNPLHSINVRLIGDSITWGSGASNLAPSTPRAHQLTDVRNNLTSKTWANLLRDYLGRAYCDEATLVEENPLVTGSGYYQKTHVLDPTNGDSRFRFVHPVTKKYIPSSLITNETRSGPFFGRIINFSSVENYNAWLEFDVTGDNIKIIYAGQSSGTNRFADVYANGVLIGSWEYGAAVLWQQESPEFALPSFGKYTIQVRNRSTDGGNFRLEGVKVRRRIRVANDGISGTWTGEWLPGSALLSGSIQTSDEFVFCQLGTNDRGLSSIPNDPIRTRDNLKSIATYLRDTLGKKVILMAANAVTSEDPATYKYNQGDVSRVIYDLSQELSLDFIDNYRATVQAKIDGTSFLADGLHPNDAGYRIIFENIRDNIERRRKAV